MMGINRPGGSLGRSQACNLALRLWGDAKVTDQVLKDWLDRLITRNGWLDIGRKRPIPHESHFQVAGYFYYFGHYYATLCASSCPRRIVRSTRTTWRGSCSRTRSETARGGIIPSTIIISSTARPSPCCRWFTAGTGNREQGDRASSLHAEVSVLICGMMPGDDGEDVLVEHPVAGQDARPGDGQRLAATGCHLAACLLDEEAAGREVPRGELVLEEGSEGAQPDICKVERGGPHAADAMDVAVQQVADRGQVASIIAPRS